MRVHSGTACGFPAAGPPGKRRKHILSPEYALMLTLLSLRRRRRDAHTPLALWEGRQTGTKSQAA